MWTDQDTARFLEDGAYFVPDREKQLAYLCRLIPESAGPTHVVEIGCGEGLLARAILEKIPSATVHAFDGSGLMLSRAREALRGFGDRFDPRLFALEAKGWREFPWPVHAIVSSLVIHHLDDAGKRALFRDLAVALEPGGALLIADLIRPTHPLGVRLAAEVWDEDVRERSANALQESTPFDRFQATKWNYYRHPDDPADQPSTLYDQLGWLEEAGLTDVDVYWMKAGHALFGARKPGR